MHLPSTTEAMHSACMIACLWKLLHYCSCSCNLTMFACYLEIWIFLKVLNTIRIIYFSTENICLCCNCAKKKYHSIWRPTLFNCREISSFVATALLMIITKNPIALVREHPISKLACTSLINSFTHISILPVKTKKLHNSSCCQTATISQFILFQL